MIRVVLALLGALLFTLPAQAQSSKATMRVQEGRTIESCQTPAVTTGNAYGTNFVVGGLLGFTLVAPRNNAGDIQGAVLYGVSVNIKKTESSGFTFVPFSAQPTNSTWTDAAAASINSADMFLPRAPIALTASSTFGTGYTTYSAVATAQAIAPAATTLYGVLLSNATLTNNFTTTSDVQVCVQAVQD